MFVDYYIVSVLMHVSFARDILVVLIKLYHLSTSSSAMEVVALFCLSLGGDNICLFCVALFLLLKLTPCR